MTLKEIKLENLVDSLDDLESEYADFFRPMLGYEAILTLYEGIDDSMESLVVEIEDETGFEFPPDLIGYYLCTNGGKFGDLSLFPLTAERSMENTIHRLNVLNKSLKESIGLDNSTLLIGQYTDTNTYVTCTLSEDGIYSYKLYDADNKTVTMEFEYVTQLVALEVSYITDYDELMDIVNSQD